MPFFVKALTIAVQVVAILEAIKNFFKKWSIPPWVYTLLSAGIAFLLVYIPEWLSLAIFAFCLAELFYDSIWKLIKNKLERNHGEVN